MLATPTVVRLCIGRARRPFTPAFKAERLARPVQLGVHTANAALNVSDSEPDLTLLAYRDARRPHPENVLLLVEVSDSSVKYDRDNRLPLYAELGRRTGHGVGFPHGVPVKFARQATEVQ